MSKTIKNKKQNLHLEIPSFRSPQVNKYKSSQTLMLIKKKTVNTTSTNQNTKSTELNEIDEMIDKRNKFYSRTLLNPYIPLTRIEKVKEITEMDTTSANRLKRYSFLFEQIKHEIYNINNMNLNSTEHIEGLIEEKDESNYYNKEDNFDDIVDNEALNENINTIIPSNSKENESMKKTKIRNRNIKIVGMHKQKDIKITKYFNNVNNNIHINSVYNNKTILDSEEKTSKSSYQSCNCIIY